MSNSKKNSKSKKNVATAQQVTEYIKGQPKDVQEQVAKELIARRVESMQYSGPIPHPKLLKEFNDVIPSGADRIMKMAEEQSAHRMELEKMVVKANNRDSLIGVIIAGIIAVISILGSLVLIYHNKNIQGFSVLLGTLGTLLAVFFKGKSRDDQELGKTGTE
ncbi:TPA: DUF2335 domain-containing protein [Streptococcus equi subsp. zooepidemicus]|nr:DUF2335 domain-containing protein [Streptococcus equi subsp. zooepidemicus]HEL1230388.1 DUF2335 domain-containing protein [Streptococcus equi subsp. zooepidemicus]